MESAKKQTARSKKEEVWIVQFTAYITGTEREWHQNLHILEWISTPPTREVVEQLIYQEMETRRPTTKNRFQKYPLKPSEMIIQRIFFTIPPVCLK